MISTRILKAASALALAAATVASAQFAGPRPTDTSTLNKPVVVTTDPAILFPPQRDIRMSPGDQVTVTVYGDPDYKVVDRVSLNGYLDLPMIAPVQVAGLSPHEVEHLLQTRFVAAEIFRDPQVSVSITESPTQIATVIGEVHGVVPMLVPKRLFDVLGAAGGLTPTTSHIVTIHRQGVDQPIVIDLGGDPEQSQLADVPVFAGDTIVTTRPDPIYVVGAVKTQSLINPPASTPVSFLQGLAMVGGPLFEAKSHDCYIIRTIQGKRTVIPVDYRHVIDGKSPDPILLGDDIVVVPSSALKAAIRSGGIGVLLAAVTTISYIGFTR